MHNYTLKALISGWRAMEASGTVAALMGGNTVPDVDIMVDDGSCLVAPSSRDPIGESRMAWVPVEALRTGPNGRLIVATSRTRFSGANRHRQGTIRTINLLHSFRNDPEKLESAAILSALVAVRSARAELTVQTMPLVKELLGNLNFDCIQDIWARSNSAPMPTSLPDVLRVFDARNGTEEDLGGLLRLWHDISFRRIAAVAATPIRCGLGALTLADFEDVTGRYSIGLNEAHGEQTWKTLTRDALEKMVWKEPRSQLALRLNVSDVAISKRCRRENIALPPRGYWQRLEVEIDPRPLLDTCNVTAPDFVLTDLQRRFEVPFAA
jgi:hypothetical protein